MSGIVIALGGNALGETAEAQKTAARIAAETIADIAKGGTPLVVTHGNGPQVGAISAAMDRAGKNIPLAECVAMTQGYIGYHLQSAIDDALRRRKLPLLTAAVVTRVLVDAKDPAFSDPTKPVGEFYPKAEADAIARATGYVFREVANRGWRRVVASPAPQSILERDAIRRMFLSGILTICGGGGGIPVILKDGQPESVAAVVDKDYAAAKLAEIIEADKLLILTGVPGVYLDYNTSRERMIEEMTVQTAEAHCAAGSFSEGSMLPKVRAAIAFAQAGGTTVITSLDRACDALSGREGTRIVPRTTGEQTAV